jgi:hypothetical protein
MEGSKAWPWTILVVTIAYLVIEISFSSELLNIVGQSASTADINSIEHWGRYISGFAAGLVLWSFITPSLPLSLFGWRPVGSVGRALIANLLVTAGVMFLVYQWEMGIVDHAKSQNSGIQRKEAVYAAFVRTGLLNGTVQLTGMPQAKSVYQTPEGKAFIALLPKLVDSESGLPNKLNGVLFNVIEDNIRVKTGGAQGFFDHVFLPSAARMNGAWEKYRGMVAQLNASYQRANNAPGYEQHAIILHADNTFHASFRNAFSVPGYPPADVNPAMVNSPSAFFALPTITRFWAHSIHAIGVTQPMFPNETYAAVRTDVWPVFLKNAVDRELHTFQSNAVNFRDGQAYANQGENAVVLLTVPALALILSVIGMLIHTTKILYYMQKLAEKRKRGAWRRFFVALGISAVIAGTFYVMSDAITVAPLYRHLNAIYQQSEHGMWPAWTLTWIIQAEHFVYPVADFLRQYVLLGFHFGVTAHA